MTLWEEYRINTLQVFLCTDRDIFHNIDLNAATETRQRDYTTDYINFCVDMHTKKDITVYPKHKTHVKSARTRKKQLLGIVTGYS